MLRLLLLVVVAVSFSVRAQAQDGITIIQHTPGPDSIDIDTDTAITVVFSQPVIALTGTTELTGLAAPVTITPTVSGHGEWLNTIVWRFTPDATYPVGTDVIVRTDDTFRTPDGRALVSDEWRFTTVLAQVNELSFGQPEAWHRGPTGLALDESIRLRFSQPGASQGIDALVQLSDDEGAVVSTTREWISPTDLMLTPARPLQVASTYSVTVADTLNGRTVLPAPYQQVISTQPLPAVAEVHPAADGDIPLTDFHGASLQFITPMNLNSLEGRIRVAPADVIWEPRTDPNNDRAFTIEFAPELEQQYTITLLAGAQDWYGNTIDTDYQWTFTIVEPPPPRLASYLALRDHFLVTNAYRPDTRLAMVTLGAEDFTSEFVLYRMDGSPLAEPDEGDIVRRWEQTFNGGGSRSVTEVLLAGATGGQLEPGLYIVQADEYGRYSPPQRVTNQWRLAVATATLAVRRSPDETLVWVTDMQSGQPLPSVRVALFESGASVRYALTNSAGVARISSPDPGPCGPNHCYAQENVLITAEAEGVFGAWYNSTVHMYEAQAGYLNTDRRVYRPGETVYFRGILRDKDDMTYSIPALGTVTVTMCPSMFSNCTPDYTWARDRVPLSYWGTINGSFTLPDDLSPGTYNLSTNWGTNAFISSQCYGYERSEVYCDWLRTSGTLITVAAFDTPQFEIEATANAPEGRQGEPLGVTVQAQLYGGGPLRGAAVEWTTESHYRPFVHEQYHFADFSPRTGSIPAVPGTQDTSGPLLVTGNDGTVTIPTDGLTSNEPLQVNMEVSVTESGESHSEWVRFVLHYGDAYVGLYHPTRRVETGAAIALDVITVSPEHEVVPRQPVTYTVEHLRQERQSTGMYGYFEWETVITQVLDDVLVTDDAGTAVIRFPADQAGRYRVRAVTADDAGRENSSTLEIQVGEEPPYFSQRSPFDDPTFAIVSDQPWYEPGSTAFVTVHPPGPGSVLLTVERRDITRALVFTVTSDEPFMVELPIGFDDAPNIFLAGTYVQPMESSGSSPQYATAQITLGVQPRHRELFLDLTASSTQAAPGETVTFTVRVTDQTGMPIRAEVGWSLVDEAVLSLAPPANSSLMATFYPHQPHQVTSTISLRGLIDDLIDRLEPSLGGGGGGEYSESFVLDPRDNYITTPLWLPNAVTDENGVASVSVVMPANLTRWRLDARVVSLSTLVGQADLEIVTTLPFFVRPQTPRFLVVGDTVELAMMAHNETDRQQTVTAMIVADGVTLHDDAERRVTLAPNSQQRIAWRATVDAVDSVTVTFAASNTNVEDAAQPDLPDNRIPVIAYTAPDTAATAGVLTGAESILQTVQPPANAREAELRIALTGSLVELAQAVGTVSAPTEGETLDRVIARLLVNTTLYRISPDPALASVIALDLERLEDSAIDNEFGWNWIGDPNRPRDTWLTHYAAIALYGAAEAGFAEAVPWVRWYCADHAAGLVPGMGRLLDANAVDAEFQVVVFEQYLRGLCGRFSADVFANLLQYRARLTPFSQGLLLLTLAEADGDYDEAVRTLADTLWADALVSATGTHWQQDNTLAWNTNILTTATVLRGLAAVDGTHELLPNIVRWLTSAQQGQGWATGLETAWSVMALLEYAEAAEETSPDFTASVSLDGIPLLTNQPAQALGEALTLPLTTGEHTLTLSRDGGSGRLYFTATLQATLDAATATPVSRGIMVLREYLDRDGQPADRFTLGDRVFVRLTLVSDQDVPFFVLADTLPAGLIAEDPALIHTNQSGMTVSRALGDADERWYLGSSVFARSIFTDDRVYFYADVLPTGTYIVTYEARAASVGSFQALPAHAYAALMPDIFGRAAGQLITVTPLMLE